MRKTQSLAPDYFEGLYGADADPWRFATSPYERSKYQATIAALGGELAQAGLEIGCSIGVLTRDLSACCRRLVATDVSPTALAQARRRCAELDNVEFRLARTPGDRVDGRFDLIVLSEVAYYWDDADLVLAAEAFAAQMQSGGRFLLVHWLGETDYPKSADEAVVGLQHLMGSRAEAEISARNTDYRLDLWRWRP